MVVTAPDGELVRKEVAPHRSVIQQQQLGTGDAVMAAAPVLEGFDGDVLTIFGDHPDHHQRNLFESGGPNAARAMR